MASTVTAAAVKSTAAAVASTAAAVASTASVAAATPMTWNTTAYSMIFHKSKLVWRPAVEWLLWSSNEDRPFSFVPVFAESFHSLTTH